MSSEKRMKKHQRKKLVRRAIMLSGIILVVIGAVWLIVEVVFNAI